MLPEKSYLILGTNINVLVLYNKFAMWEDLMFSLPGMFTIFCHCCCSLLTAANGLCHSGNEDLMITPLILHPNTHTSNRNDIHHQIGTESLSSISWWVWFQNKGFGSSTYYSFLTALSLVTHSTLNFPASVSKSWLWAFLLIVYGPESPLGQRRN